ncbi:hypothetical protein AVEN_732-1 [Araneus ventricosus]|uniref:Uncharacterized protein n=1 Tax=Araneus ventricosus TaxID=182803 RepID=A0A4Y2BU73_ARAVE|nr:hypothetical protein AVEN_732-1 [Araneus ventricosus]
MTAKYYTAYSRCGCEVDAASGISLLAAVFQDIRKSTKNPLCQEISRREVIIDKNQDFAQKCRKAIREILINGGNEALVSSRNNELLSYEAKIAESEAALISIGPCPVMSCTKHHEAVKDVEMDETGQLVALIFR